MALLAANLIPTISGDFLRILGSPASVLREERQTMGIERSLGDCRQNLSNLLLGLLLRPRAPRLLESLDGNVDETGFLEQALEIFAVNEVKVSLGSELLVSLGPFLDVGSDKRVVIGDDLETVSIWHRD